MANDFSGFGIAVLFLAALAVLFFLSREAGKNIQPVEDSLDNDVEWE